MLSRSAPGRRPALATSSVSQRAPSPLPPVQVNQHRPLTEVTVFVFHALVNVLTEALPNGVAVDADVGVARYRFPAKRRVFVG